MDIIDIKKSKSTIFILPLLYPEIKYTDVLFEHFINCYISDERDIVPDNSLIIEFDDNVCGFRLPEELIEDYNKILHSQYSEISNESKIRILYFWQADTDSYLYSVLYKTSKILEYWSKKTNKEVHASKDKEYWPKFNIQEETRGGINHTHKSFNLKLIE